MAMKQPLQRDVLGAAVLRALDADARHAGVVAQHFIQGVELQLDLAAATFPFSLSTRWARP